MRVFIDHGDRTDRKKARLKYVLDAWGHDKFLAEVEAKLGRQLTCGCPPRRSPRPTARTAQAHVGIHPSKQAGKVWAGVVLPVGRMTAEQMRGLAKIARELGDGDIRLTVWQNLLISGIAEDNAALVEHCLDEIGLTSKATSVRAGLVACTGNTGCKFAASNTKGTAMAIADWVRDARGARQPRQHPPHRLPALLRPALHRRHRPARLPRARRCVGGGHGRGLSHATSAAASAPTPGIARELYRDVKVEDCPARRRAHAQGLSGAPRQRRGDRS